MKRFGVAVCLVVAGLAGTGVTPRGVALAATGGGNLDPLSVLPEAQ